MLLEAGADANVANEDGQTPLMLAARTGNVAVAELLVRQGANVNARERFRDQTAVMWAAAQGHAEMVSFLVSKGADLSVRAQATDWPSQISNEPRVQYRPVGGLTPLLYAARAGCLGCVKAMVEAGADKDRPNPDGMTPMIMALDNGSPPVRALPARARRQPAHLGLVGPHAAVRGGDDARRAGQPSRGPVSGVAGADQGAARRRRESERAAGLQGAQPRRARQPLPGRSADHRGDAAAARRADLRQRRDPGAARARRAGRSAERVRRDAVHGRRRRRHADGRGRPRRGAARERRQAVAGNNGHPAQGRRGRQRPHHRHHQPHGSHRADQHVDRSAGSDDALPRGRGGTDRGGPVSARARRQGGRGGRVGQRHRSTWRPEPVAVATRPAPRRSWPCSTSAGAARN